MWWHFSHLPRKCKAKRALTGKKVRDFGRTILAPKRDFVESFALSWSSFRIACRLILTRQKNKNKNRFCMGLQTPIHLETTRGLGGGLGSIHKEPRGSLALWDSGFRDSPDKLLVQRIQTNGKNWFPLMWGEKDWKRREESVVNASGNYQPLVLLDLTYQLQIGSLICVVFFLLEQKDVSN